MERDFESKVGFWLVLGRFRRGEQPVLIIEIAIVKISF